MNKIYKVVWNTVRNCYVVGSELISSKSGRHSTSNGKSSSLKVTLTVLALCGMTALGSGVAPAYAADAGATTDMNQYVALKYDNSNNQNEKVEQTNGKRQTVTTFNGKRYIKVDSGVNDNTGRPIYYWVREGYSLTMVDGQPYTSLSSNGRRADVSWTGDANAKPSDILESVTSTHVQTNVTTNVGETLQQVNAGTYAGVTNSGGTEVDGDWDYIVKDSSWKGVVNASNYRNGYANLISNGKPKGFVRTTDAGSKLAWNANLNAYTYNGKVVDYSNIYVIDGEIGVFTNASGSEVYTGTVFGKNNEVLMTVKKSDGKYYSYWGAEVNDAGATMDTYRVAEYQKDLNVLRDNDFALYHNDIKSVDMSTDASSATISLMRNGDGTTSPAVDGTLTLTNGGGTDGKDTYVRISNTTNGQEVSKTFSTGSKVEAVGTKEATTGLTINGETYKIKTGQTYTEGDNITIDGNKISATDTTLVAGKAEKKGDSYIVKDTAGKEVTLEDVASATTVNNNYTTLDTKIDKTKTDITNEYNTAINNAKTHYYSVNSDETGEGSNYNNDGAVGLDSIAVGANAYANGRIGASAFGNDAYANGERALAIGNGSKAQGLVAIAIGTGDSRYGADGTNAIAVGEQSYAKGDYTTAVGGYSKAEADKATAFGHQAVASGSASTAIGMQSQALGDQSTAIGDYSNTQGTATAAFGGYSKTTGDFATSLGYASKSVIRGTAVGAASSVTGEMGTAVGLLSSASVWGSVALGGQSSADTEAGVTGYSPNAVEGEDLTSPTWTSTLGAVSVGTAATVDEDGTPVAQKTRQITNLAAGTVDTDAVNVAQLKKARVELTNGTNTTVKSTNDQTDGYVIYSVDVSNEAIQKATDITGNNGIDVTSKDVNGVKTYKVSAKLSDNLLVNDAGNIDLASVLHVGSKITVDGNKGEITGLTNKTLNVEGFATQGRAATEEQLSAMQNRLTTDDKYVTSGTIDKANGTMKLTVANVSTPVSISGLTDYQVTQNGSSYDAENHRLTLNLKDTMNASNPAQSVTFDGIASTTDVAKATTEVKGGTNIASVVKTDGANGNAVYTVNAKGTTVSTDNNFVLDTTAAGNNVTNYGLSLADSITIGKGESSHPIVIDGNKGEITGLTNKTLNVEGFATKGRAATEEQLSAMQSGLTAADKYVTSGTIDKTNGTMKLTVANVSTPVSITGLTDYQVTQDGSSYDAKNHRLTLNLKDTMNTSNPAQSVTFDGIASTTDVAKATTEVKGGTNIASVAKTEGDDGHAVYTVNAKGTTVSTDDNFVLATTNAENNVINYGLSLANSITIGKGESSHPIVIDGNKGEITGLTNKTLDVEGFATKGRAATEEQLKAVDEKAAKAASAKTIVEKGKNMEVTKTDNGDGSSTYTVGLADNVSLGNNAIQLNGSDGSISATSGTSSLNFNNKGLSLSNGKNSTVINGGTITVNGGESVISGTQATFGKIKLNAESGSTITGLSNTTTKYDGFATAGRAATEEQLKEVSGQASEAIETAGKGWNLTTNGAATSKTNIAPDGTVDFSSGNDNLVISNAGANLSFSLSDNLDLTNNKDKKGSVKVGENTALSNELLQVGKDVSLTASALNVGTSSLTTSALMVGGLTYINSSGINANNRVISNVAAGTLDTDAVNVGQLKSAISGSQVSIDAGTGIIVEKTGNKYTIKTNIEGLSNDHGTVTVSTNKDSAPVTDSGASMPAHAKRMNLMLMANDLAEVPETTTLKGDTLYVKHSANSVKLITDEIANHEDAVTLNDGEKIDFVGGKNITTSSEHGTDANGKNYDKITFSLKDNISVTSVTTDKITINNGPTINSSGIDMNNQKITNLKNGEIAEGSKDAVNGGQIYDLKQNVSTNTENINILNEAVVANAENINSLSHSLNKLDSRINRVGAGAAALAALHPLDFDPDNKWDFAAGYGNYAGANAVAIGTYYRPNENTMFSIGGSFGGGENMINAGVSFKLGSGGSGITTSKTVMAKKIKEQDELLKAQDAKMKEQDEKIAKLEALVAQQGEMIQQALGKK